MDNPGQTEECRWVKRLLEDKVVLSESATVVLQSVINEIKQHGRTSMDREVCGVLVGSLCEDKGRYVLVDGRIEGRYANNSAGSVTFTSDTWAYIHSEKERVFPDRQIVGWYHTHPGFGIFLSPMDTFIHRNFFPFEWQMAYVYDPQSETEGFFFGGNGEVIRKPVAVIKDSGDSDSSGKAKGACPEAKKMGWKSRYYRRIVLVVLFLGILFGSAIALKNKGHINSRIKKTVTSVYSFGVQVFGLNDSRCDSAREKKSKEPAKEKLVSGKQKP